jgi:hypothetical protein
MVSHVAPPGEHSLHDVLLPLVLDPPPQNSHGEHIMVPFTEQ